jgi:NAD(P)H-hydrate epimerase
MDLYESIQIPIIIDADAINILAAHKDNLPVPSGPRILTPHPGEMARLLAISPSEVQADRLKASRICYQQYQSSKAELIVILKGAATLVADAEHQYVCTTGNSAMAAGGMGDVLSGLIGSLICQGLSPLSAGCLGVYLHGCSGNRLLTKKGVGFSAADLADELPHARKTLEEQS